MFKILGKWENIRFGVVKNWNMKLIISRQLPDSPPPQQGASDPISGITGTPILTQSTSSPKKQTVIPP